MGTVHAKSLSRDEKEQISLEDVKAKVDKVHIDGIARTKDDILKKLVKDLFKSENFQEVILNIYSVREKLEKLGAFKQVGIFIDTSTGPGSSPDGLEVTFHVAEVRRVTGGINTLVGNNEGSLVTGISFPNIFGRGEAVQAEYHYGTKRSSGFDMIFTKPFFTFGNPRIKTASFQQGQEFPWSGFRELDRGLILDLTLESLPQTYHSLQWEGIWRELKSLSPVTSFPVREESGHSLKSAVKHIFSVDRRDNPIIPNHGYLLKFKQEYAGLGGDVGFLKHEFEVQVNQPVIMDSVLQATLNAGVLNKMHNKSLLICDRFFLGGPLSLRGFTVRGVGPQADDNALGAETYWAGGLHLYTPLPFRPARDGIGNYFRTHFFVNTGNIGNFVAEQYYPNWKQLFSNVRWSCGAGIVLSIGHAARFELNYCLPIKAQQQDRTNPGIQFGIGVTFL